VDSKDYLLNDGKNELKLTKIILDKNEWKLLLNKLQEDKIKIRIADKESTVDSDNINNFNKRKCIPLITNVKLFPDKGDNISIIYGNLGSLYFRLHWALNGCPQTSELSNISSTPENIYSDFIKWWRSFKMNSDSANYINVLKVHDNKFRINDMVGFLSNSIDYKIKTEIKTEDEYDDLHIKYVMPWTFAAEICLNLIISKIIDSPDKSGFITINK
jgi:hypothetical protein